MVMTDVRRLSYTLMKSALGDSVYTELERSVYLRFSLL